MSASTSISVSALERDLNNLWREEASVVGDEEQRAVTRARVLNLLVYNDASGRRVDLDEAIAAVTERHPARALVMWVDRSAENAYLSAAVTSYCQTQGARAKQVTCEQVTFDAGGEAVNELPSAIAQLLTPDVANYLWWRDVPDIDDYLFNHLVRMVDRVIIDVTRTDTPREEYVKLAKVMRENPKWVAISDFTWQRLTPWRQVFASFYDVAAYQPYLERVDSLTIEYDPHEGQTDIAPRALLLGCWIAERLGWKLDSRASRDDDQNHFIFRAGDRKVEMQFNPIHREGMDGLVASATLGVSSEPTASFRVARAGRHHLASDATLEGRTHAGRTLGYKPMSEQELLSSELSILAHDRLYEAAVAIAGELGAVR